MDPVNDSSHDYESAAPQPHERSGDDAVAAPAPDGPGRPDGAAAGEPRMSRGAAWLAMAAVAAALLLVYLAPSVNESHGQSASPETAADAAAVGRPAPLHFTLKDMNGIDVKLSSFKGKVIVLNFWATWCGPCEVEIPWLVEIQNTYRGDLVVLGVSMDDTAAQLKPYAVTKAMNYPVLLGIDRDDVKDAFGPLFGIPVSIFIDRDGVIARRHSGIASKDQFEKEIKALL